MIHRFVRRANICAVLAIISGPPILMSWPVKYEEAIHHGMLAVFMFFFWLGIIFYIKAKGHHPAWLIMPVGLGRIGMYGLLRLKDRHKAEGARPLKRVKFPTGR